MTRSPWPARSRPAPTASGEARQPGAPARVLRELEMEPRSARSPWPRTHRPPCGRSHRRQRGMAPVAPGPAAGCRGNMDRALATGQRAELHFAAHRAYGALAAMGLEWAAQQSRAIEHEAQQGDLDDRAAHRRAAGPPGTGARGLPVTRHRAGTAGSARDQACAPAMKKQKRAPVSTVLRPGRGPMPRRRAVQ